MFSSSTVYIKHLEIELLQTMSLVTIFMFTKHDLNNLISSPKDRRDRFYSMAYLFVGS